MLKKYLNSFLLIIYCILCLKIFISTIHSVLLILVTYLRLPQIFFHYLHRINNDVLFDFLKMHLDFTVFSLIVCLSFIIYQLKYHEYNWKFNNWKDFVFLLIFCFCIYEGIQTFIDLFNIGYKTGDIRFFGTWQELEGSFFLYFVKTITISLFVLGLILLVLIYKNIKYTQVQKILLVLSFGLIIYFGSFASYYILVGYPSAMSSCFELDPINYNLEVLKNFQTLLLSNYSLIPISLCNPENIEPCFELKQKMNTAFCQTSGILNQFYIPHQKAYAITEILKIGMHTHCTTLQTEYYDCLDTVRREAWVKRYIELHHTPKYQIPIHKIVFPKPRI